METDAAPLYGPGHVPAPGRDYGGSIRAGDGAFDHRRPGGVDGVISLFRGAIPRQTRIPIYTVAVATLVTMTSCCLKGFSGDPPGAGLFIPLIVVELHHPGADRSFAARTRRPGALADALGYGLGFTWALTLIGADPELWAPGPFGLR